MTVANPVSASSPQLPRAGAARLAAAANPVLAGPEHVGGRDRRERAGDVACITLANAHLRLDVAPTLGGGITRFDWRHDGALVPIFRRCRHVVRRHRSEPARLLSAAAVFEPHRRRAFQCSRGGAIDVPRNRADEPLPIHGDGWLVGVAGRGVGSAKTCA